MYVWELVSLQRVFGLIRHPPHNTGTTQDCIGCRELTTHHRHNSDIALPSSPTLRAPTSAAERAYGFVSMNDQQLQEMHNTLAHYSSEARRLSAWLDEVEKERSPAISASAMAVSAMAVSAIAASARESSARESSARESSARASSARESSARGQSV